MVNRLPTDMIEDRTSGQKLSEQLADNANLIVYITDKRFGAKGDGLTDDTTAIQAAIDYVYTRGGGIVGVPFSVNPFVFTSILVKTNVTLKGYGGTLKLKDNVCVNAASNYYPLNNLNFSNVTYDSLIVDGNQANNTQYTVADIITCTGLNSKVINCDLRNAPDSGIMFSSAEKGRCQNNRISNCRDLGIYVNASASSVIDEAMINGNIIDQCTYGGIGLKRETNHVIVSFNTITNCGNGITVEDFTSSGMGYPKNFQIVNNSIKNIGYVYRGASNLAEAGISVSKADNAVITNNKVFNCSGNVMNIGTITNTIVANNLLEGYPTSPATSGNSGIYVASATDCNITNNIVKNVNDYGGYLLATNGGRFTNNDLTSGTVQTGLRINATCLNTLVQNNSIKGGTNGDTAYYAGNTCIIKDNLYKSATAGTPQYYGYRTLASGQPTPDTSVLVPLFIGEQIVYLQDNSWWISHGMSAGNWKKLTP